jgi:hypothetical protein
LDYYSPEAMFIGDALDTVDPTIRTFERLTVVIVSPYQSARQIEVRKSDPTPKFVRGPIRALTADLFSVAVPMNDRLAADRAIMRSFH